jgi:hypothetical protein
MRDQSPHAGNIHDKSVAPFAHRWQDRLRQRHESEKIGLEHGSHCSFVTFLNRGVIPVACVVDQHVDRTERASTLLDRALDVRFFGHVQRERERGAGVGVGEISQRRRIARRQNDAEPALQRLTRELASKSGRASGDHPYRRRRLRAERDHGSFSGGSG